MSGQGESSDFYAFGEQESPVYVTLGDGTWTTILEILFHACQLRGGDWIEWQAQLAGVVNAAMRAATVATHSQDLSSCPECGESIRFQGTDHILAEHLYGCRCGYSNYSIPMSRQERMEQGDFDWLEDWDDPNDY